MGAGELEDVTLIARSAAGDQDAFMELYRRHSGRVNGFAIKLLGSVDEAEEVVEETFMEIWTRASDYRPQRSSPVTWIFLIARSRIVDRLRRLRRLREFPSLSPGLSPDPGEEVLRRSAQDSVRAALEVLPTGQREVIDACYYGGLSQSEAATALGVPLGTLKTRARAALGALRAEMRRAGALDEM